MARGVGCSNTAEDTTEWKRHSLWGHGDWPQRELAGRGGSTEGLGHCSLLRGTHCRSRLREDDWNTGQAAGEEIRAGIKHKEQPGWPLMGARPSL